MLRRHARRKFGVAALLSAVLALGAMTMLHGQGSARVSGVVKDPAGAIIPGAEVTLTQAETGQSRTMRTSAEGSYTFLDLPPGSYSLTAKSEGFKTYSQSGITVQVGHAITANIAMEIGSVNESLTVAGEAALVNTQTATLQQTVDSKRITELPLNGRNVLQLQALLPGVVSWGSGGQFGHINQVFVVNGARTYMVNYLMDGGTNVNSFWNVPNDYPNPDALQEFTAKTHSFSAVYGRNAGAVIEAATKSGSNQFHGGAFEFVRNTVFDGRAFFAPQRPPFKRNQYGAMLGGPITKNRNFFFFSWQGTKERGSPGTINFFPLTQAELNGDFSAFPRGVTDPISQQPFPGNIIPRSRWSSVNQRFLQKFPMPAPNAANGLYTYAPSLKYDQKQFLARFDSEITSRDRIMGRFYWNDVPRVSPWTAPPNSSWFPNQPTKQFNYSASYTRTFSPTLINQVQLTYTGGYIDFAVAFPFDWGQVGANVIPSTGSGTPDFGVVVSGKINWQTGPPTRDRMPTTELKDTVSIIHGRHSIQTGFQLYRNRVNQIQDHMTGGIANYSGFLTGNPSADFLLGEMDNFTQYSGFSARLRQTLPSAFVQDDIKVSPRLTLNLGLRWDPFFMYESQTGQFAFFSPGRQSQRFPKALPGILFPGDPGVRSTVVAPNLNNWAPRFGFAWDPFGKTRTSIRGSYGIFYDPMTTGINLNRFMLIQPFQLQVTTRQVNIANPWNIAPYNGVNPYPYPSAASDAALKNIPFTEGAGSSSFHEDFFTPYNQQWDLSIQHELAQNLLVTVAYVGSKGTHLYHSRDSNPARYSPEATLANTQQRRTYPWVGRIQEERTDSYANHNAFQLSIEKRYSRGFTVMSNYTYGKTLGLIVGSEGTGGNGMRNPWNWRLDYGRLNYDIRHNFITSFIWEVPAVKYSNPVARHALQGWNVNGIFTFRTGTPFTVASGRDNSFTAVGRDTADLIGNPILPDGRSRDQQMARYFNTDAFAVNGPGTYGTAGQNILESPGFYNLDMGIFKNFILHESHRLQFRLETFNTLNHANLGGPDANRSSPNFGKIFSVTGPRVVELGLKYNF